MRNEKLRHARETRGWTQKDVADNIDLPDVRSLRRWERGEALPTLYYRAKLCELFGMDAQELQLVPAMQEERDKDQHADAEECAAIEQSALPVVVSKDRNRQRILERVHAFWIEGMLEQSLQEMATISLHLQIQPDALTDPWEHIVRRPGQDFSMIPHEKEIVQIYEEAYRELLILGEPGSGKTTLLLQLARHLLSRAFVDEEQPIPVVLNLSSWTPGYTQFTSWLIDELNTRYHVPHDVGQAWVENDRVLLLLDGIDEVSSATLDMCISSINDFHQVHSLVPLVICARKKDYFEAKTRFLLQRAITIQPLAQQQIEEALGMDTQLEAICTALREDQNLRDIVNTPLMLSILVTTYRHHAIADLSPGSLEARRQQLIRAYIEQMLAQQRSYRTKQRARQQLAWLARQMQRHYQSEFYLERMQLDWLPNSRLQQACYGLFSGLWAGFLCGGLIGFIDVPMDGPSVALCILPCLAVIVGMVTGMIGAMLERVLSTAARKMVAGVGVGGIVAFSGVWANTNAFVYDGIALGTIAGATICVTFILLSLKRTEIHPTEALSWSWKRVQKTFSSFLLTGLLMMLAVGTIGGLFGWFIGGLGIGMILILLFGMLSLLIAGLLNGLSSRMIDEHIFVHPNQGIYRSCSYAFCNGLIAAMSTLLALVMIGTLSERFFPPLALRPHFMLFSELAFSITVGIIIGVYRGGEASIKHMLLRLFLWCGGYIPWNYQRFLNEAARCILLRKVGGGYIFIHQLVLDYFATLDEPAEKF